MMDSLEVLDLEQILGGREAKAADLGVAMVAEVLQLGPGRGRKPQDRAGRHTEFRPFELKQLGAGPGVGRAG